MDKIYMVFAGDFGLDRKNPTVAAAFSSPVKAWDFYNEFKSVPWAYGEYYKKDDVAYDYVKFQVLEIDVERYR